jgi:hypothetical protein
LEADKHLEILETGMIAFGAILTIVSFAFSRMDLGIGILVGGAIALLNFRAWKWFGKKLLQKNFKRPQVLISLMTAKTLFPFALIGMAIWGFNLHAVGLSLGLSSIIAAVFFYTFWLSLKILWRGDKEENGS